MDPRAEEIVVFWCRERGPMDWFRADPGLDAEIARRFGALAAAAAGGALRGWLAAAEDALALLILLDQVPRNLHRGRAGAFAADALARRAARAALALGHDMRVPEPERQIFYLPLMHSESAQDQALSVALALLRLPREGAEPLRHARLHRDVIRRFGRFPSRNAALGRADTPAERAYRAGGGYLG